MPLAEMTGPISVTTKRFGERDFLKRQRLMNRCIFKALERELSPPGEPVRQVESRGVFAGQNARS
jgi:hypothetical protein